MTHPHHPRRNINSILILAELARDHGLALRKLLAGTDPREADVGSIIGFGFAPYSGGTLSYIDNMGAAAFVKLCEKLAKAQFAKRVDVVFAAAGGTGVGIYQASKDAGKYAIGVDSNQNHLQPGTMLTSMVKRVDVAVYNLAKKTTPGVSVLGLKEGGVDYALDQHNEKLISADMKKKVDAAKADIIAGKIKVADYMATNSCTY